MTNIAIFQAIVCQLCLVGGQICFKKAMNPTRAQRARKMAFLLLCGIGTQTAWFILWTDLLSKHDLSRMYPFEGLNSAILAVLAWLILKEQLSVQSWIGLAMICTGIAIASGT